MKGAGALEVSLGGAADERLLADDHRCQDSSFFQVHGKKVREAVAVRRCCETEHVCDQALAHAGTPVCDFAAGEAGQFLDFVRSQGGLGNYAVAHQITAVIHAAGVAVVVRQAQLRRKLEAIAIEKRRLGGNVGVVIRI